MHTKSYNYNQAIKYFNRTKFLSRTETKRYIKGILKIEIKYTQEYFSKIAIFACQKVKNLGKYPYNSEVANVLMDMLDVEHTPENTKRAETLVYYTNSYQRNVETIELYHSMQERGYMPIHDITEDMNGKHVKLKGSKETILGDISIDKTVRLVCKDGKLGYQQARMRSKYYIASIDADYFIKLIKSN